MTRKRANRLDTTHQIKLIKWLEANKALMEGQPAVTVRKIAAKALGFEMSESSIRTTGHALGYKFTSVRGADKDSWMGEILLDLCKVVYGEDHEITERVAARLDGGESMFEKDQPNGD